MGDRRGLFSTAQPSREMVLADLKAGRAYIAQHGWIPGVPEPAREEDGYGWKEEGRCLMMALPSWDMKMASNVGLPDDVIAPVVLNSASVEELRQTLVTPEDSNPSILRWNTDEGSKDKALDLYDRTIKRLEAKE